MNIAVADLVDVLREYEIRLQRRDADIENLERERDELLGTMTRMNYDLEQWRRALIYATGEPTVRALGTRYPEADPR